MEKKTTSDKDNINKIVRFTFKIRNWHSVVTDDGEILRRRKKNTKREIEGTAEKAKPLPNHLI